MTPRIHPRTLARRRDAEVARVRGATRAVGALAVAGTVAVAGLAAANTPPPHHAVRRGAPRPAAEPARVTPPRTSVAHVRTAKRREEAPARAVAHVRSSAPLHHHAPAPAPAPAPVHHRAPARPAPPPRPPVRVAAPPPPVVVSGAS